ncbi:MAG: MTH938/NDUFAF3 family protein [Candidatus Bathyarchaeia archaeon]
MIESYEFGSIVINRKKYTKDLIIFPEKILDNWWRKEGHMLNVEDLKEIFEQKTKPEMLVVGTGYYGIMKISPEVNDILKAQAIKLIAQPTKEACQTFNKFLGANKRVVGAFHLTC